MIKIIEDGMEYAMEYSNKDDCDGCKLSTTPGGCHFKSQEASFLCGSVTKGRGSKMRLICTSAQKITEEAKVYGPHNSSDAKHLAGKKVELWVSGGWEITTIGPHIDFGSSNPFFSWSRTLWYSIIREIPQRHLTWPQIQALHDDLADVVLVEDQKND